MVDLEKLRGVFLDAGKDPDILNFLVIVDNKNLDPDHTRCIVRTGMLRKLARQMLKLAEENEAARNYLGWIANGRFSHPVDAARNFLMPKLTPATGGKEE